MSLFTPTQHQFATLVRRIGYANQLDFDEIPPLRAQLTNFDLGQAEEEQRLPPVVNPHGYGFLDLYARRVEALLTRLLERIAQGATPSPKENELYEDLVIAALFYRHFAGGMPLDEAGDGTRKVATYRAYRDDFARWTRVPFPLLSFLMRPEHAFAIHFQIRRAYGLLWQLIRGASRPAGKLRAAIWHSIFPRELRLYGQHLYNRMHDVTTLILGPSGTGKELVATAIGLSRFIAFDPKRERFVEPLAGAFHAINLAAMPRDLIESEMFGHTAGSFTGATKDREGWFEKCKRGHTVFLDEIGELAEPVQVKLLRVLQNREFYRVGDTEPKRFEGRVIAATNRDFAAEIVAGRFRQDLYFRLCSDVIRTPSLREQLDDSPEELPQLVALVARRCLGDEAEEPYVAQLAATTVAWVESSPQMGSSYAWPGNFRELEQCVRSVMVRGEYHPPLLPLITPKPPAPSNSALAQLADDVAAARLTFDELLERYCSLVFARSGNIATAARRLKKHRATVQARVRPEWVEKFRGG